MNLELIKGVLLFFVLCLAQVLVLNNIHLFNCATPLLYVYMILMFRRNYPRWGILLWSFVFGLVIDTFSDTPGVATGSMTLLGFLQPYVLEPFIPRDSADDLMPSMKTLGVTSFVYYTIILVFIYCLIFFTLEMFNFFNLLLWAECVGGSTLLTIALLLAIEKVRN